MIRVSQPLGASRFLLTLQTVLAVPGAVQPVSFCPLLHFYTFSAVFIFSVLPLSSALFVYCFPPFSSLCFLPLSHFSFLLFSYFRFSPPTDFSSHHFLFYTFSLLSNFSYFRFLPSPRSPPFNLCFLVYLFSLCVFISSISLKGYGT